MKFWSKTFLVVALTVIGLGRVSAQSIQGTVRTWGSNQNGQLGNGTRIDSSVPIEISSLGSVMAIAPGSYHSLAVKTDGTVWAWGRNFAGQLGNGSVTDSNVPVQVFGLSNVVAIAVGQYHSVALKTDGTVWTWGYNYNGPLGNGTNTDSSVPVQVTSISAVVDIAAGQLHTLALKADGTLWGWGYNGAGELGDGTYASSNVPVLVLGLGSAIRIAAGSDHNLALKADGTVWAWGNNDAGQLGNGTAVYNTSVPVQVQGLAGPVAIAAGYEHSLAVKSDGTVWCWGWNGYGQLGNGSNNNSNIPVQVSGISNVIGIAGGVTHSIALKSNGAAWGWGDNLRGQLGNGTSGSSLVPVPVNLSNVVAIGKGSLATHSMAIAKPSVPFASANAKLEITVGPPARFDLNEAVTLGPGSNGVDPLTEDVRCQVGGYSVAIPRGAFTQNPNGRYVFSGVIDGVSLAIQIEPLSPNSFAFKVSASGVNLSSIVNPVAVVLTIGDDSGSTTATAQYN